MLCDLAETYNVYDFRALPVQTVAIFAAGLPDNARIKRKISKTPLSITDTLLGAILDCVNLLLWTKTEDAQHNRNRPRSVMDAIRDQGSQKTGYSTPEEFEAARAEILRRLQDGN